jgi:hypothetical protein
VPTQIPPHEFLYHFQLAPLPREPPTVRVTALPEQIVLLGTDEEILTVCACETNATKRNKRVTSFFILIIGQNGI